MTELLMFSIPDCQPCRPGNHTHPAFRGIHIAGRNGKSEMIESDYLKGQYNDLCLTCRNYASCMYVKAGTRPVYHCEEFENYPFRPVHENSDPIMAAGQKKEEKLVFYGLCKNCANRMTCMNACPDRIIWHCEEYA